MNLSKVIHAYRYLFPEDVPHELRDLSHKGAFVRGNFYV